MRPSSFMTQAENRTDSLPSTQSVSRHNRIEQRTLSLEGFLVIVALTGLLVLDLKTGSPFFDRLTNSRLALCTLIILPLFLLIGAMGRHWDRMGRALSEWWPVLGVLIVYESLKHLHANRITEMLGILPKDGLMLRADTFLFGRALPLWLDGWTWIPLQHLMWFFYVWAYYIGPVLLLGYAFFVRDDSLLFRRLRRGLVLGLLGGYLFYLFVPVAGPLFTIGDRFTHPIVTQPELRKLLFSTLRYNWDCFPSLHTAVPILLSLLAWPSVRSPVRIVCVVSSAGIALACLVLRFHYGIDIIAGILWAILVWGGIMFAEKKDWRLSLLLPRIWPARWRLRRYIWLITGLFAATGFIGLVIEQAFEKMLGTLLGSTGYATMVVLAVYFIGLTLGGAGYGRLPSSFKQRPLRLYGVLEGGVALNALCLYLFFDHLISVFAPILSLGEGHFYFMQLLRLLVSGFWMLPITVLMGATFPAVVDALRQLRVPQHERAMTLFYGVNLVGAILGSVLGPYIMFARMGIDGSLLVCLGIDLCVALMAFQMDLTVRRRGQPFIDGPRSIQPQDITWKRTAHSKYGSLLFRVSLLFSGNTLDPPDKHRSRQQRLRLCRHARDCPHRTRPRECIYDNALRQRA